MTSSVSSKVGVKLISTPDGPPAGKLYTNELPNVSGGSGVPAAAGENWIERNEGDDFLLTTANDRLYLAPDTVGTYTFKFYEDVDGSGDLSDADNTSSIVTLTVKEPSDTAAAYKWVPSVTVPSSVAKNVKVPVTVDLSGLTLTDARGSSALGTAVSQLIGLSFHNASAGVFAGAAGATTYAAMTGFGGTSAYKLSGKPTDTGELDVDAAWDTDGDAAGDWTDGSTIALKSAATTVNNNGIASVDSITQVPVSGEVAYYNSSYTAIKDGRPTATYQVATTGSTTDDSVYFTLTPGVAAIGSVTCSTTTPTVTADGTLLATYGDGVKLYSALVNQAGVATLTVRSSDTTGDCANYSVDAYSNAVAGQTRNAKYVVPKRADMSVTNSTAELLPSIGTASVTLKASLVDQFGIPVAPLSSETQQASLTVGNTTVSVPAVNGAFSYTYTPSSAPSSPTTTPFNWSYLSYSADGTITWSSTANAGSVSLNTPNDGASHVKLASSTRVVATQNGTSTFGDTSGQVTGVVTDTSGSPMAYKKVTLTGDPGVLFSTLGDGSKPLTPTIDVVTNGSGQFSGAYAFFTKAGTPKVTATVGDKSDSATVTTEDSTDPYIVSVNDVFGITGTAIRATGRVLDIFGNPVPNNWVHVAITPTGSAAAASSDTEDVKTSSDGTWSKSWTSAAGVKGDFVVTATGYTYAASGDINDVTLQTGNALPSATWATTAQVKGLPDGQYKDMGKLTVGPIILTGPKTHAGPGLVTLTGVANPNATVEIKGLTVGGSLGLQTMDIVTADEHGDFSVQEYLRDTTTFVAAVANGGTYQYSPSVTIVMSKPAAPKQASAKLTAKALGRGKVAVSVNGSPDVKGTITLYMNGKKVKSWTSTSKGDGSLIISTSRGKKTFQATFAASGCKTGSSSKVTVTVK